MAAQASSYSRWTHSASNPHPHPHPTLTQTLTLTLTLTPNPNPNPNQVLHGAKDPICYQSHAEWFRDNIPSAQLRVLPEGKHNLHLKFADEVNAMIRAFVEGREVPQPAPPAAK